jgi:hypothetical protein
MKINGVPGSGGGCGVGVTSQKKLWSSFETMKGSCNNDEEFAVKEGIRRLNEMFYFVGVAEVSRRGGYILNFGKLDFQNEPLIFCSIIFPSICTHTQ